MKLFHRSDYVTFFVFMFTPSLRSESYRLRAQTQLLAVDLVYQSRINHEDQYSDCPLRGSQEMVTTPVLPLMNLNDIMLLKSSDIVFFLLMFCFL